MAREVGSVSSDCFCGRFGSEDGKVIHLIDLQRKDLHRSSYREETGQTSKICRKVSNFWAPCPTLERKTVRVLSQCTRKSRSRSGSPRAVFVSSALIIRHKFGAQCVNPRTRAGEKRSILRAVPLRQPVCAASCHPRDLYRFLPLAFRD